MKKSDDLANAFLLKHYPGRRRLSASVPAEVSSRNRSLIATTALVIAIATSVILIQRTHSNLQVEKQARIQAEQRLSLANQELERVQKIKKSASAQLAGLARAVQDVSATAEGEQKEFLSRLIPEALQVQVDKGIPASLVLAVAIKESNYGQAEWSRNANNLFSLKASDSAWSGQTWTQTSKERKKKTETIYRLYPDLSSSVQDYAALLKGKIQSPPEGSGETIPWLEIISEARGADRADWQGSIQAIMEKHQLQKLDSPELLMTAPVAEKSELAGRSQSPPWEKVE